MAGKYISLLVHFTWSTAGREPWLEASMREHLYSFIGGIMRNKKARLLSAGGMFDHIPHTLRCRQQSALQIL